MNQEHRYDIHQPDEEIALPAPAVFDTDDPAVTPERPRIRLAPQQALLLARP